MTGDDDGNDEEEFESLKAPAPAKPAGAKKHENSRSNYHISHLFKNS